MDLLASRHGSPDPLVWEGDVALTVGARCVALGLRRVWLVTDAGLAATGWVDLAEDALLASGVAVTRYAETPSDPSDEDVVAAAAAAARWKPDGLVALGGGSVLDTAKGVAMLLANGGRMEDWWGFGKAAQPCLPVVAVPATAGTGSEAQSFAVIRRAADGQKMACGSTSARPRAVLLDARLTHTAPRLTTIYAGLDAIGHAVETAVCSARTPQVTTCAVEAAAALVANLPRVVRDPGDAQARGAMLHASWEAGLCIEASMLGAAHACANALSAVLHLPHGAAVGVMLPRVVRHNSSDPESLVIYGQIATRAGWVDVASGLDALLDSVGVARDLRAWGVGPEHVPTLCEIAARQWTAGFNPVRPVAFDTLFALGD